jgi:hypothetical protein
MSWTFFEVENDGIYAYEGAISTTPVDLGFPVGLAGLSVITAPNPLYFGVGGAPSTAVFQWSSTFGTLTPIAGSPPFSIANGSSSAYYDESGNFTAAGPSGTPTSDITSAVTLFVHSPTNVAGLEIAVLLQSYKSPPPGPVCTPPTNLYNINYIKSVAMTDGNQYTIALDAGGNLWVENVVTLPLIMQPLQLSAIIPGSYAQSATQDDVEYICFSNLKNGTDIPRQYNPQPNILASQGTYTLDRISQVGPGAPPTFQATLSTGSQVTITSWAAAGGVVTFQAVNAFTAGEVVTLSKFAVSTFFNGLTLDVLGTGLSGTQFQVSFSGTSGPSDSGIATPQYSYPISGITQPPQKSDPDDPGHFQALLWSSGPGSTSSGNVITVYYQNAFTHPTPDETLVNEFLSGIPTYIYISDAPIGNGTYLVTGVGTGIPPGGSYDRYYFTVQAASSNYQFYGGPDNATGFYQLSLSTLVVLTPIPNLEDGDQITITGVSPGGWNATWTVTNSLASGVYNITQTQMTNGTATYTWSWAGSGTAIAPTAGQLVTVIQTLNGNGIFNVTDAVIATVSGGPSSGTFTINNFANQNIAAEAESGQAQTAGTQFQFDPGQTTVGTLNSPIFGNATANQGSVSITGANTAIGAGTRQAVCFFETRNGYKTACSAPITFTTSNSANYILASNIPIGPPNVVRRWIAFTGAGANGIPGPNFYTIDTPVTYTINNQTYLYSATYIDDNVTTQAKFTFTDAVLLAGDEIDVEGNNLFAEIELGSSAWTVAYAQRMVYGLEQNKVLNFTNMSFDGGYLPNPTYSLIITGNVGTVIPGNLAPLGWGIDATSNINSGTAANITSFSITGNVVTFIAANAFIVGQPIFISGLSVGTYLNNLTLTVLSTGLSTSQFECDFTHANVGSTVDSGLATPINIGATLRISPIFGNSYYIQNLLGATQSTLGMIIQNAYQDAYNVPIILPDVLYSVRVTARIPSGLTVGSLFVDLTDSNDGFVSGGGSGPYGITYGSFSIPFASMTTSMAIYTGTLLTTPFTTAIPKGLLLRVYAQNIGYGADVEIDRLEVFPTYAPLNSTSVRVSYVDNFEAFDANTGNLGLASHNTQPCLGGFEMHDQLYFLKSGSMESTEDVAGIEPSGEGGGWSVREVSNRVGTCGINAYDYGEEWALTACRNGVYGFNGGQPIRIDFQQKEIWESINWAYGYTICLRNDIPNRKIYCAVPLPTPNQWLPLAPLNANPTSPNVIMMWNYQGLDTFEELVSGRAMHTTMFGTLAAVDMRIKCSLWNITTPYMAFITQPDLTTQELMICNGVGNEKIYKLSATALSDDGNAIDPFYVTYGFVNAAKASQNPLLGFHRKRFNMLQTLIYGSGNAAVTVYPNYILNTTTLAFNPSAYSVPGGINLQATPPDDIIRPLNVSANRVFVGFGTDAVGAAFTLTKLIMVGAIDQMSTVNPNSG